MATTSITKKFVIKDDAACEKLIQILSSKSTRKKKKTSNRYEEGKKILTQFGTR